VGGGELAPLHAAKARLTTVVTPAGLERYFAEVADRLASGVVSMDEEADIAARYGQEFLDRLRHWGQ